MKSIPKQTKRKAAKQSIEPPANQLSTPVSRTEPSIPIPPTTASTVNSNSVSPASLAATAATANSGTKATAPASVPGVSRPKDSSSTPAATKSPAEGAYATKLASEPQPTAKCKTTFELYAPEAKCVSLCGEFNAWSPDAAPMHRLGDGRWETDLLLPPGRYQYKFVADGQWLPDPNAMESVPNVHGSINSVLEVRA